jgi:hypothetical protein
VRGRGRGRGGVCLLSFGEEAGRGKIQKRAGENFVRLLASNESGRR